tara:strand:- start:18742 stop:19506 length:765 start_codon:yes stop_codon:yes gene_type:complete
MKKTFRVIAKIDIKSKDVIKGINFEGMRVVGKANKLAEKYFFDGADELIINDVNASLFGRSTALEFLKNCTKKIFIPVTLSGGLKNITDVRNALKSGADKVAINTAAVEDKSIISKISREFGSQALIISINAKKISKNKWLVFTDKGREKKFLDAILWAKLAEKLGAGEIHVNSIDQDGTKRGFDYDLAKAISESIKVPLVIGGGLGNIEHIEKLLKIKNIEGISTSSALHYRDLKIDEIKKAIFKQKINVRLI